MVTQAGQTAGVAAARAIAAAVPDPELPVVTVADLGILRDVTAEGGRLVVTITPTYSGCPALPEIAHDLRHRLSEAGFADVTVRIALAPAWSSDWITAEGRRKLQAAGIAPPHAVPAAGPGPPGTGPADPHQDRARAGPLPALRLGRHDADRGVRRDRVQGAVPLRELPRALRIREGNLMAGSRTDFHPLTVARVDPLTGDSAAVTFDVPPRLAGRFAFAPGQSVTVRRGNERRSYSICAIAGRPPRIGVREVAGGAVSGWLVHEVRAGDVIEVQAPSGSFTPDLGTPGHHVLIAAGSGITPVLSIAGSVLAAQDKSVVTLLYGNRRNDSVMFADEIADLKDAHPERICLVHVLSREPQEVELFNGRLDAAKLRSLLPVTVEVAAVDHWWLCGPFGLVEGAIGLLTELGVPRDRIHRELFYVEDTPPAQATHAEADPSAAGPGAEVTVLLDGRSSTVTVPVGTPVLDGAQRVRPDLPFACKGGVCGTCRALLVEGEVTMRRNYALEQEELDAGYILTCQALPASPGVIVDYDA